MTLSRVAGTGSPAARRAGHDARAGHSLLCSAIGEAKSSHVLTLSPLRERHDLEGYTFLAQFKHGPIFWKAFEDLRTRDEGLLLISDRNQRKLLTKSAEPTAVAAETPYLGLTLAHIAESLPDVLAQRILQERGDPNPELVKTAVPPIDFMPGSFGQNGTFIGTQECWDTQPVHWGSEKNFEIVADFSI